MLSNICFLHSVCALIVFDSASELVDRIYVAHEERRVRLNQPSAPSRITCMCVYVCLLVSNVYNVCFGACLSYMSYKSWPEAVCNAIDCFPVCV